MAAAEKKEFDKLVKENVQTTDFLDAEKVSGIFQNQIPQVDFHARTDLPCKL